MFHSWPHIGMRNIKTTLAVTTCVALYWIVPRPSGIVLACIAAIVSMQSTIESSVVESSRRIGGTMLGGCLGGILSSIPFAYTQKVFTLLAIACGTMLIIYLCNLFGQPKIIPISLVVFLVVMVGITDQPPFLYAVNRTIDSIIGIVISLGINLIIRKPETLPVNERASSAETLADGLPDKVDEKSEENRLSTVTGGDTSNL